MIRKILGVLVAAALISGPTVAQSAASRNALPAAYSFQPFEVCPGCSTATGGINDEELVGATQFPQGYIYDAKINLAVAVPGALAMTVPSDKGEVPGIAFSSTGLIVPLVRERDGTIRQIDGFPGALITQILQFNGAGASIGAASLDFVTFFGFVRSPDGVYTRLDCPFAMALGTFPLGWKEDGTIIGYTTDPTETDFTGFIRHRDGAWEVFVIPGASSTLPSGINERGAIAGGYRDVDGWHGFVWLGGTFRTIDVPGAADTALTGINNQGTVVGNTFNNSRPLAGPFTGFVARPVESRE
jgi:hypothetical protein